MVYVVMYRRVWLLINGCCGDLEIGVCMNRRKLLYNFDFTLTMIKSIAHMYESIYFVHMLSKRCLIAPVRKPLHMIVLVMSSRALLSASIKYNSLNILSFFLL